MLSFLSTPTRVTLATLVAIGVVVPAPAALAAEGTDAPVTTALSGELVVVERANIRNNGAGGGHAGHGTSPLPQEAMLDVDGTLVPLDRSILDRADAGDTVRVVVQVPSEIVDAVDGSGAAAVTVDGQDTGSVESVALVATAPKPAATQAPEPQPSQSAEAAPSETPSATAEATEVQAATATEATPEVAAAEVAAEPTSTPEPTAAAPAPAAAEAPAQQPSTEASAGPSAQAPQAAPGTVVITAEDLDEARTRTASDESDLAQATAAVAGASATNLSPTSAQVTSSAPVAAAATTHSVTVAVVGYKGTTDASYTDAAVRSDIASVSSYWSEQTGGALDFTTASITRYNSTIACSAYSYTSQWNEARTQTGFTAGANKHLVILFPQAAYNDGCSYGLGTVGSSVGGGGSVYVTDLNWAALAHELGHNMSLQHANYLACLPDVIQNSSTNAMPAGYTNGYASGCGEQEYGDGLDVMSSSPMNVTGGASSVALRRLGVLGSGNGSAVDVSATGVTTHTLSALSTGSGLRSVKVVDPRSGNAYYIEDRAYSGRDTSGYMGDGSNTPGDPFSMQYGVRVLKVSPNNGSLLLDPTPNADPWAYDLDQIVKPGTTWSTSGGGIQIRTTTTASTASTGQMQVQVSVAPTGTTHWAPASVSTTTVLNAPASVTAGSSLTLSGTVSAASGSAAPTGTVNLSVGSATTSATLTAGSGASATYTATVTAPAAGTYTATASYVGVSGFTASSGTASVTTTAPVVAPAATTTTLNPLPSLVAGTPATISGTVTASGSTPTGTVTVSIGSVSATATLNGSGAFSASLTPAAAGPVSVSASYGAVTGFAASNTSVNATVAAPTYATTTTVDVLPTLRRGAAATITGTVTSTGGQTPTGTVNITLSTGGSTSATLNGSGAYSATVTPTSSGVTTVTAQYAGAGSNTASSGTRSGTVGAATSTVSLSALPSLRAGQAATITGTVSAAGGVSAGTVIVSVGTVSATVPVSAGSFSASLTPVRSGAQSVTASYSGVSGTSTDITVDSATTTATVAAIPVTVTLPSPAAVASGQPLTVAGTITTDGAPTGTVTLVLANGEQTNAVLSGTAFSGTFTSAQLGTSVGYRGVQAVYSGDDSHESKNSLVTNATIYSPVTVTIASAPATLVVGQTQDVTVTVAPTVAGATLDGAVRVTIGGTTVTTASDPNAAPVATVMTLPATTTVGTRSMLVEYLPGVLTRGASATITWNDVAASTPTQTPTATPTSTPVQTPTSTPTTPTSVPTSTPTVTPPVIGGGGGGGAPVGGGGGGGGGAAPVPTTTPSTPAPSPQVTQGSNRLAGADRVDTAVQVSRTLFPTSAKAVVITSSANYADALAGGRLASAAQGPLLLTSPGSAQDEVIAEAQRLLGEGGTVYLLGGQKTLSADVQRQLSNAGLNVERIAGDNRYETAALIAQRTAALSGDASSGPIYLATGTNFPDGLAVSALASNQGGTVLLTEGGTLPTATADYLRRLDPSGSRTIAVGGPAAAAASSAGVTVSRTVVGSDRYETASLLAGDFKMSSKVTGVGVASGENWPDALVGGAAMGSLGGPLLLSNPSGLSSKTGAIVSSMRAAGAGIGIVFGGPKAVGGGVESALAG